MKVLGVIGIDHENLTANPLRLGNSSRVVMGERCVEPLGDRLHWPARRRVSAVGSSILDSATGHYISTSAGRERRSRMAKDAALPGRKWLLWVSALLLIATGCAARGPVAEAPIPAGQGRIWVYRNWLPSESLNLANIEVNGVSFGSVENGGALYRDVPPGTYHVFAQSWAHDPKSMDTNFALVPGQQVYIKIIDLTSWATSVSASKNFQRDAFWAWLIPPQVAQAEIARDRNGI